MDTNEVQKILRYAQLTLKRASLEQRQMRLPQDEAIELEEIPNQLGLTHEEIIDLASKNLMPEDGCH
jgi:hypothetical protein